MARDSRLPPGATQQVRRFSRVRFDLRRWLRPYWLVVLFVGLSFLVWVIPWGGHVHTGFTVKQPLTLTGLAVLALWYGTVFASARVGYALGKTRRAAAWIERTGDRQFYLFFTALAAVGVVFTYFDVFRQNPHLVSDAFTRHTFNSVRYAVPYHASLQTLRYASILAGAFAGYEILARRKVTPLHVLNILLLLASAAIASRLSIALATLLVLGMVAQRLPLFRISALALLGVLAAGFLLTTPLNYIRNANFYRNTYGLTNPLLMNAYDIISYVGAPFQASIGVANNIGSEEPQRDLFGAVATYLTPTYFHLDFPLVQKDQENYRSYVNLEAQLTTNSAFAEMYGAMGWLAFPFIALVAFAFGAVAGHATNYKSLFFLLAYVIAYAFVEFDRVYLFNYGIIHFLALSLVVIPVVAWLLGLRKSRNRSGLAADGRPVAPPNL